MSYDPELDFWINLVQYAAIGAVASTEDDPDDQESHYHAERYGVILEDVITRSRAMRPRASIRAAMDHAATGWTPYEAPGADVIAINGPRGDA